ncbi:GNAT family N-acetyltransferase [Spirillospora sp. NPDC029432]|uniref:GNAT family N-acetyltransferase n=1 Tax=Spirillospora sp. NPDC029432 TaxID=3154599 RepID=UPI0034566EB0
MAEGPIRRLDAEDDLAACLDLAQDRSWSREEDKWRLLFDIGAVYGLDDREHGGLAGTVVSTPYGKVVSAISMVLVARRHERRGLGGRLMRHALEERETVSACLTATEYGRVLYERLGFRAVGQCTSYTGELSELTEPRIETLPLTPADIADVVELDTDVFGAPRDELYRRLPSFCEDFRVVRDGAGRLAGFGGAWSNGDHLLAGPVIARDASTAIGLVETLLHTTRPVRLDVDDRHPFLGEWARKRGLTASFGTTLMEYGEPLETDPSRMFVPVMQALG